MNYTPEGISQYQYDIAVSYLHLIDKKLKKIGRNISILTILGIGLAVYNHKDKLKKLKNMKGE